MISSHAAFAEGDKISAITVKGNNRIDTAAILQAVREKPGDALDEDQIDADLRAIYRLGHFSDVKAEVDRDAKGVTVRFVVQEKPVVRDVKIEGAKEISTEKVRDAIEIKANTIFSDKDLAKSIKKVKKLYMDEGYYLAEVEGKAEKRSARDLNVVFRIKEGKKVLIRTIQFEGNHAMSAKKLRKSMETKEKWFLSWLTGAGTFKEEQLHNDAALITEQYMNNGYINVKVGEPAVEVLPDKSGLKVTIGITEGDQYRIGALGFRGDLLESEPELLKRVKTKPGEIFNRSQLRTDVFSLTDLYADKGFAFANAAPATKLNENRTVDITFDMEKGDKVYIDRINVSGNAKTRDKVIRRELRLAEGDLYGSTPIKRSKQNLMNLGFFEEANITTTKGSADNKLDMNVEVKEKPTGTFSIGAGYSSLDGIIGQGSVSQSNFLGLGLKGTLAASFGSKSQTYNVGLTDPYFLDSKWTLGGDIYRNERQYIDYTRRATGADIKTSYPLSDTLSTFWLYRFEKKEIFDESDGLKRSILNGSVLAPELSSTTSSIEASITSNTTDYRIDPSTGMVNTLSAEFAGLGGTNRYVRYSAESAWFHPVGFGTVASVRGTIGQIKALGGRQIPIDERFYLGGISTLRGFEPRTVCPVRTVDLPSITETGLGFENNRVYLGGDTEFVLNLEYQIPLLKDAGLKAVIFGDAGNADNGYNKTFSKILASYGAGIRWISPIGPLRLEYGIPVNPRSGIDKSSGRLEFSIGNFF